ncbi:hypothetical protein V6Z11_D11G366400 [Gossypium hirsutum]
MPRPPQSPIATERGANSAIPTKIGTCVREIHGGEGRDARGS